MAAWRIRHVRPGIPSFREGRSGASLLLVAGWGRESLCPQGGARWYDGVMIESTGRAGDVVITISSTNRDFHWKAVNHGAVDVDEIKVGEGNSDSIVCGEQEAEKTVEPRFGPVTWQR